MDYNRPKLIFNDLKELRIFGYCASLLRILWTSSLRVLHLFCTSTEALLWIQLVAEHSLSSWRALVMSTPSARYKNAEPSLLHFIHTIVSVNPQDCFCRFEQSFQSIHTIVSVNPHDCFRQTIMYLVCNNKKCFSALCWEAFLKISCA